MSLYRFVIFALCSSIFSAQASTWIDANNLYLRDHIQRLADANIITAPVTTYPLMWDAIDNDLQRANTSELSPNLSDSYVQVMHYYQRAVRNDFKHRVEIGAATGPKSFNSFGDSLRHKAQLAHSTEYVGSFWAGRLSTQVSDNERTNQDVTFDGSYLAAIYGNWILRAGAIEQWWGPAWDSSLIMSNNARPLPAINLSRSSSDAFETPLLSWIGPWTLSTQMAKLESDRAVPNALLWSTRTTLRPLPSLEIGASWSIQWGGDGQPSSLKDFWRSLTAQTQCVNGVSTCESEQHTKLGNHLAGFDIRWSHNIAGIPFSVYGQTIGEDAVDYIKPADKAYVFGVDTSVRYDTTSLRIYLDYTETQVACGDNPDSLNCYYEHSIYKTGYRYHGRAIGTTYDNDALVWSLGVIAQQPNLHQWHAVLRVAQLNTDNSDRASTSLLRGNQVSKYAQDLTQLDIQYQLPFYSGLLKLSGSVSRAKPIGLPSKNTSDVSASWIYRY